MNLSRYHFAVTLQFVFILFGALWPGGEPLGAWLGMKAGQKNAQAKDWLEKNFSFQLSWWLFRVVVMFVAGLFVFLGPLKGLKIPDVHGLFAQDLEINLPADPGPESELQAPLDLDPSAFETNELGPIWPGHATAVLVMTISGILVLVLWIVNWILNWINLWCVLMGRTPHLPLIWPIFKRKGPIQSALQSPVD